MVATFPSGSNTFVPDLDASGRLVIGFSRNPKKFRINRYVQIIPCKRTAGFYLNLTAEEAARVVGNDAQEFDWPDGEDAPNGVDGTESFDFLPFKTRRRVYAARLGDLAAEQADWDITQQHLNIKAQQAMTVRTQSVVSVLSNPNNYDASHRLTVDQIAGNSGTWAASTTARQDIKRSLNTAAQLIHRDTVGVVDTEQLHLVIGPAIAADLGQCQEIVDHIKGSPEALAQVRGELPGGYTKYGLPSRLYGFELHVEDAVRVSSKKGATRASDFLWPADRAVLCARVGELEGVGNAPNFSTVGLFVYSPDDMTVETMDDRNNRRKISRVVDNYDVRVMAPASAVVFSGVR